MEVYIQIKKLQIERQMDRQTLIVNLYWKPSI